MATRTSGHDGILERRFQSKLCFHRLHVDGFDIHHPAQIFTKEVSLVRKTQDFKPSCLITDAFPEANESCNVAVQMR